MIVLHASDLHLGRPLRGIPLRPGLDLDAFRHCAARTLTRLVDLAIAEKAALLLLAGDLIEQSVRNYKVGLRLVRELSRLESLQTQVVWVRGNHDAENRVIEHLLLPSHVHEIGLSGVQTLRIEALGICVVGASYARRTCFEDLLSRYPSKVGDQRVVGLLHTSADGAVSGDRYAPCRKSDLVRKGYDYFALGHVHQPMVLCHSTPIAYSGSLQGRSFMECGARGCMTFTLDEQSTARPVHRSLELLRFGVVSVDVSQASTFDRVLELIAERAYQVQQEHVERALVARFRIRGRAGIEVLLAQSTGVRERSLWALVGQMPERLAVDGFWLDLGHSELPVLGIPHGNEAMRIDVY
jgi:DNA repair protein SbcD/Mre11